MTKYAVSAKEMVYYFTTIEADSVKDAEEKFQEEQELKIVDGDGPEITKIEPFDEWLRR